MVIGFAAFLQDFDVITWGSLCARGNKCYLREAELVVGVQAPRDTIQISVQGSSMHMAGLGVVI